MYKYFHRLTCESWEPREWQTNKIINKLGKLLILNGEIQYLYICIVENIYISNTYMDIIYSLTDMQITQMQYLEIDLNSLQFSCMWCRRSGSEERFAQSVHFITQRKDNAIVDRIIQSITSEGVFHQNTYAWNMFSKWECHPSFLNIYYCPVSGPNTFVIVIIFLNKNFLCGTKRKSSKL